MRSLTSVLNRLRRDDGLSLIEVTVTMLLLGILAIASVTLISSQLRGHVSAVENFTKQSTAQTTLDYLHQRIGTSSGKIGIATAADRIDPLSIAGDQLLFVSVSTGNRQCVRVAYEKAHKRIRVATYTVTGVSDPYGSAPCTAPDVKPVRGPNQQASTLTGAARCDSSGNGQPATGFDPAVDLAPRERLTCGSGGSQRTYTGAFILASNVVAARPVNATASGPEAQPDPLRLFTYLGADDQPLTPGPADEAQPSAAGNAFYDNAANAPRIVAVDTNVYLEAKAADNITKSMARRMKIVVGGLRGGGAANTGGDSLIAVDRVLAYNSTNQLIDAGPNESGPLNILRLDSELVDTAGTHETGASANSSRVVVPADGMYVIDASFRLTQTAVEHIPSNYGGGLPNAQHGYLLKNGSVIHQQQIAYNTDTYRVDGLTLRLKQGDYLQLGASSHAFYYGGLDDNVADRWAMGGTANDPNGTKLSMRPW